jgi:hypothetical protein
VISDAVVEAGEGMCISEVRLNSNLCVKVEVHMRLSDEKLSEFPAECKEVLQLRGSEPEANSASASQIPCVLWNQKIQCLIHKNSSLVPLLSHVNLVFALSVFSFNIHISRINININITIIIIISSFHLRIGLASGLFLSDFLTETV